MTDNIQHFLTFKALELALDWSEITWLVWNPWGKADAIKHFVISYNIKIKYVLGKWLPRHNILQFQIRAWATDQKENVVRKKHELNSLEFSHHELNYSAHIKRNQTKGQTISEKKLPTKKFDKFLPQHLKIEWPNKKKTVTNLVTMLYLLLVQITEVRTMYMSLIH